MGTDGLIVTVSDRLSWARKQQALTLEQVSMRCGLSEGYISKLEGAKRFSTNPTLSTLQALATALEVTVPWLFGEGDCPANRIAEAFHEFVLSLPAPEQETLRSVEVDDRIRLVIHFLCDQFPDRFTLPIIAFHMEVSLQALIDIMERRTSATYALMNRVCDLTSISPMFFAWGDPAGVKPDLACERQAFKSTEQLRIAAEPSLDGLNRIVHFFPEGNCTAVRRNGPACGRRVEDFVPLEPKSTRRLGR